MRKILFPVEYADMSEFPVKLRSGEPVSVGEIPNPLAFAHFISTTPLFSEAGALLVVENEVDRSLIATALKTFQKDTAIMEWKGEQIQLATAASFSGILVADMITMDTDRLPSPTSFKREQLRLAPNDFFSLSDLKTLLIDHGYERDKSANMPKAWAARGDVLDLFIDEPLRIQFDGDRIESISSFDLGTGAVVKTCDSIIIPPLNMNGQSTLLDHIPDTRPLAVFHLPQIETTHPQLLVHALRIPDGWNAGYGQTASYHSRAEEIKKDITGHTLFIFGQKKSAAIDLVGPNVHFTQWRLPAQGFTHAASLTMVLTDQSLGLTKKEKQKKASAVQQAMLKTLTPGDYVVHMYHGIAKFQGTTVMHVNKMDRDYFVLEYAGNDKIYIPVELAERIDAYVGDPEPKLNRLSEASWNEAVMKVKKQALEMARELLDLYARRSVSRAPQILPHDDEKAFNAACKYKLTPDQKTALADIGTNLSSEEPMDRLLCGDVGFGKTEVALRAAYRAVLNGYQVALMAPTTILVQQHFDTFAERLKHFDVRVGQLSRFKTVKEQKEVIEKLRAGEIDIVVGTHRLLSRDVHFKRLGLIVIDEEQRFGVRAKEGLKKLRMNAHILSMTATPIPRTLHLSLSGVRDVSTILTPPNERKAVKTVIQPLTDQLVRQAIEEEIARGGQSYYLYNRVQSIQARARSLQILLPKARIGIAHGQLKPADLASVMHDFDVGDFDVLLATTIIENGLDIPTANTLIVENASMFGLSELYQLKGRVGRSDTQGYAYFLYKEAAIEGETKERFLALQSAEQLGSGFDLAMKDMEIRGIGNILGKKQHGHAVKIGLHLYVRLLQQAVQEIEGEEVEIERDIPIDLPLEARIPEELLPEETERILLYQQLASIRIRKELIKKKEKYLIEKRFGSSEMHPSIAGLFDLLEIKLLASRSSLLSIDTQYPNISNRITSPVITLHSEKPFIHIPEEWEEIQSRTQEGYKIRASIAELGEQWPTRLKLILESLDSQ